MGVLTKVTGETNHHNMDINQPLELSRESLCQLPQGELVDIVIEQASSIQELRKTIIELETEIQRIKVSNNLDSKTSSKPPSGDILKKSENKPDSSNPDSETPKRKPGGQPGHPGKTRKGFGRVDRFEILRPDICGCCGHTNFALAPIKTETQQVAQLVPCPIEIVEYHRHTCLCEHCGNPQTADWSVDMVPGQDLGIRLQAFLGWINNYGHLPYEKQQEMLWELGGIEIGVGTLVTTNQRIDNAVNKSVQELKDWIQQTQPNIHSDVNEVIPKGKHLGWLKV